MCELKNCTGHETVLHIFVAVTTELITCFSMHISKKTAQVARSIYETAPVMSKYFVPYILTVVVLVQQTNSGTWWVLLLDLDCSSFSRI